MIFGLLFSQSLVFTTVLMFLLGVAANGRWTIAYIYLMEFWMTKMVVRYVPFVNCAAGVPPIIGTLLVSTITGG